MSIKKTYKSKKEARETLYKLGFEFESYGIFDRKNELYSKDDGDHVALLKGRSVKFGSSPFARSTLNVQD